MKNTGASSGVVSGVGDLKGRKVSLAVMDFRFIGGSMGSVEGEKIARALKRAYERKIPAIVVSASGGARMQEGSLSLMQMGKTSAVIALMNKERLPYISVMTNPTTGGVTASFAMLGDINIAEPGALIGFAGERVIRETIRQNLPPGFQRAEFLLEKGFLDMIVPRSAMKDTLATILSHLSRPRLTGGGVRDASRNLSYADCLAFLYARNQFAVKLGLHNIAALLERLGRPQDGMPFLHVAGTNGKGSVCANLAAMLRASGYGRVGLYTSPHLVSFRERIQVDGEPIPKDWIAGWMRKAMPDIEDLGVTYFEIVTAMALDYFRAAGCQAVVLETGLGGRLDATNIVQSAVTVITSISLDHTQILGSTVEEIWREKIAILKPGVPMVVSERRPHLLAELEAAARAAGSPVHRLQDHPWREEAGRLRFRGRLGGYAFPADLRPEEHQRENLALSLLALEAFLERAGRPVPDASALLPGLRGSRLPGRTQPLTEPGMLPLILDGAHNPGGVEALSAHLRRAHAGKRILALFAVMKDKDVAAVYRAVAGFASDIRFVPLADKYPRALTLPELRAALAATGAEAPDAGLPVPVEFPLDRRRPGRSAGGRRPAFPTSSWPAAPCISWAS